MVCGIKTISKDRAQCITTMATSIIGNWEHDKRSGQGKYIFANGAYYEGTWKDDMKNGYGSFRWPDHSSFTGNWVNNLKEGKGLYIYADGDEY